MQTISRELLSFLSFHNIYIYYLILNGVKNCNISKTKIQNLSGSNKDQFWSSEDLSISSWFYYYYSKNFEEEVIIFSFDPLIRFDESI